MPQGNVPEKIRSMFIACEGVSGRMTSTVESRRFTRRQRTLCPRPSGRGFVLPAYALPVAALLWLTSAARAQISFTSAVGLAVSNSPRVRMAQADLDKAHAAVAEAHDAYLPIVQGIMDLGYSYGAPLGEPTLFSFDAHSLVFNYSQHDYIRAAASGLTAAKSSLEEAREEVAEDAATTYVSLDSAQQRRTALADEYGYANQLARIVQDRIDLGQDTQLELKQAQRIGVELRLQILKLDDDIDGYRSHLARLDGLPDGPLVAESGSIPALPEIAVPSPDRIANPSATRVEALPDTPAVKAAFANAQAKQQQAFGDSRYLYRPQVGFFAAYSRFSTFNNYETYYPAFSVNTLNAIGIGIQITIPFYDPIHQDKAGASLADARHAEQEALAARNQMFEGRIKLQHASAELAAQAELAGFDQQIAQLQLDAILTQLQAGTGNPGGPQLTPKDEQKARIQERQHYIDLLNARSNLRQTQIQILRLTGQLDTWLKSATVTSAPDAPATRRPAPR
jgi:outer membrane protein TolC